MAARPILDFGIGPPPSRERTDKGPEGDPQQIQNANMNRLVRQTAEPRVYSKTANFLEFIEQIGKILIPPLSVLAVGSQIESLLTSEDVEVRPTSYAHLQARRLVTAAYFSMFSDKSEKRVRIPPLPSISTDDVGGILISWTSGNKYLAANFGARPESRSFVYFEQGATHQALDLIEQNLLEKLKWLSA